MREFFIEQPSAKGGEEISANISEVIGLLVWSDWLTMIILIVFIGLGIKLMDARRMALMV
jgi:hypothetical protein